MASHHKKVVHVHKAKKVRPQRIAHSHKAHGARIARHGHVHHATKFTA